MAAASKISRSTGDGLGPPRRGVHVALGVGKLKIGRVFIVSSRTLIRQGFLLGRSWTLAKPRSLHCLPRHP